MATIDIESGPAKVILSGSVFSFGENPIKLTVSGLKILLQFEEELDDQGKPVANFRRKMELIDQNTIKFTFTNYMQSSNIGTIEPLQIGRTNKDLFINYMIQSAKSRKSRLFHYTFYEVENNAQEANTIESQPNVSV
jgi:hypothetical protein